MEVIFVNDFVKTIFVDVVLAAVIFMEIDFARVTLKKIVTIRVILVVLFS